ncbi:MAG: ABC transporter substrate-binding protein [Actinomycetota bacterium]|nr:ABC transporter substrate-binding protein [Actinomycetota bacterium]
MERFDEIILSRRGVLGLGAAAAAGLALAACGSSSKPTTTAQPTSTVAAGLANGRKVTVKTCVYAKNHASSMLYWQKFAPPGVTVTVAPVTSTAEILQALEGGTLDLGLMSPYVPMLTQAKGGITSKTVGMVARQGFGLIGKVGEVTKVADLRGKKIAIPPPGSQVLVINQVLAKAGLTLGTDLEGVPLGYADHLGALTRGDVQAFIGSEPPCTQAVVNGVGVRLPGVFDTPLGDLNTALWASSAMLKDDELTRVVVKMQKDAAEYLTPNGVNDKAVWHDLLVDQFGFDEKVYAAVLENVGAQWKFDKSREDQYVGVGKALVASGDLKAEPDYEALYARQYWSV